MEAQSWTRRVVATLLVAAGFWLALVVASLIGWSFEPGGWHRVREHPGILLVSFSLAAAGISLARLVTGRSPLSWWLLFGLIPPLFMALSEGGVL